MPKKIIFQDLVIVMDCSPRIDAFPLDKFTLGSTHIVLQK